MKKPIRKSGETDAKQSPNCLAVLAIATEMVRRLNENISKVQLKPLEGTLVAASRAALETSKA